MPVVLYEREAWSLIQRDEHKSEVFENNVHIKLFGPNNSDFLGITLGY